VRGIEFHRYHYERNGAATLAEILAMKQAVASPSTGFLVAILPVFFEGRHDFASYPLRDVHEAVRAYCEKNGIAAVDLLPAFERAGGDAASYALDPWHLSVTGHELVAWELTPLILPADADRR
jgi:hypothetical protein